MAKRQAGLERDPGRAARRQTRPQQRFRTKKAFSFKGQG
jgi:hypothetical protein